MCILKFFLNYFSESQTVCKDIPKEVCHLRLANPRFVKKPVTLRWCTKPKKQEEYKPSYLPPPVTYPPAPSPPPKPTYNAPAPQYEPPAPQYEPPQPSYGAPSSSYSPKRKIEVIDAPAGPPVYKPRSVSPGSPVPTSSPVYYKPIQSERYSRRF